MPRNENGSKLRRIANQKWTQNGFLQNDDTREFHMPGKPRSEGRKFKQGRQCRSVTDYVNQPWRFKRVLDGRRIQDAGREDSDSPIRSEFAQSATHGGGVQTCQPRLFPRERIGFFGIAYRLRGPASGETLEYAGPAIP